MEQREDLANNKPLALEHKPHGSRTSESSQAWPPTVRPADRNIRLQLLWGAGEPFLHLVTRAGKQNTVGYTFKNKCLN